MAAPLGLAEFSALLDCLADFETSPFVAVAVSGGPDSLALAILASRWAQQRGGSICALSVDHRLRLESESEAARVSRWLAVRSIRHEILVWHGEKPRTGIQEAARLARYRLLDDWCRAQGCLHLLTAHHGDDQFETHLLRRKAGSGPVGLAGMSAIRELDNCRILRPLLGIAKARLLGTLAAENQPYISDPSNRNLAFARARLRADEGASGIQEAEATLDEIGALAQERVVHEHACDALLARSAVLHRAGFAMLDTSSLLAVSPSVAEQALSALVFALGGRSYPPRRRSVAKLLLALGGKAPGSRTLGGFRFVSWRNHILTLRELAHAPEPVTVPPGATFVWDRSFEVASSPTAQPLTLGYLGKVGVSKIGRQALRSQGPLLPPLVYPILPGFWDERGLASVPSLGYVRDGSIVLPSLNFRPVNSLSHASFAVV